MRYSMLALAASACLLAFQAQAQETYSPRYSTEPVADVPPATQPAPPMDTEAEYEEQTDTDLPLVHHNGDVSFVTGGIGETERAALEKVKKDYNFSLLSARTSGSFSGDTHVIIRDKAGNVLIDSDAGPIFLAQLPKGSYTMEATGEGQAKTVKFNIVSGRQTHQHLTWK